MTPLKKWLPNNHEWMRFWARSPETAVHIYNPSSGEAGLGASQYIDNQWAPDSAGNLVFKNKVASWRNDLTRKKSAAQPRTRTKPLETMMEGEHWLPKLSSTSTCAMVHMCPYSLIHTHRMTHKHTVRWMEMYLSWYCPCLDPIIT